MKMAFNLDLAKREAEKYKLEEVELDVLDKKCFYASNALAFAIPVMAAITTALASFGADSENHGIRIASAVTAALTTALSGASATLTRKSDVILDKKKKLRNKLAKIGCALEDEKITGDELNEIMNV